MRTIGETIYTGLGLRCGKSWFNEQVALFAQTMGQTAIVIRHVGSTVYWRCGHVTDHGSVERPARCPICSCDRLRLGDGREG